MAAQFEVESHYSPDTPTPLEARIPLERRSILGRHMAQRAFMDGFHPLEEVESIFESLRDDMNERIIEQPARKSLLSRKHILRQMQKKYRL